MRKKVLAWLLCMIMVISMLPAPVWAEGEDPAAPAGTEQSTSQTKEELEDGDASAPAEDVWEAPELGIYSTATVSKDAYLEKLDSETDLPCTVYALFAKPVETEEAIDFALIPEKTKEDAFGVDAAAKPLWDTAKSNVQLGYQLTINGCVGTGNISFDAMEDKGSANLRMECASLPEDDLFQAAVDRKEAASEIEVEQKDTVSIAFTCGNETVNLSKLSYSEYAMTMEETRKGLTLTAKEWGDWLIKYTDAENAVHYVCVKITQQGGSQKPDPSDPDPDTETAYGWVELRDVKGGGFADGIDSTRPEKRFNSAADTVTADDDGEPAMMQFVYFDGKKYTILVPDSVKDGDTVISPRVKETNDTYVEGSVYTLSGTMPKSGTFTVSGTLDNEPYSFTVPYQIEGLTVGEVTYDKYDKPVFSVGRFKEIRCVVGQSIPLRFYYNDKPVTKLDHNDEALELSPRVNDIVRVEGLVEGEHEISYGGSKVTILVTLPDHGIYSGIVAKAEDLVEVFDTKTMTEVWLLTANQEAITDTPMIVDNDEQPIVDTPFELVQETGLWKLRLKDGETFTGEERLAIIFNVEKDSAGQVKDFDRVHVTVRGASEPQALLMARLSGHQSGWTYDEDDLSSHIRMEKGQSDTYVLLLDGEPCMDPDELTWDTAKLRLRPMGGFLGGYDIDALDWGQVAITHTASGKTAYVDIEPGFLELYSQSEANTDYYLSEAVLTAADVRSMTVYAMFREPVEVEGDVTCQIDKTSIATATATPIYRENADKTEDTTTLLGAAIDLTNITGSGELRLVIQNGTEDYRLDFRLTMEVSGADDTVKIPVIAGDVEGDSDAPRHFSVYREVNEDHEPVGQSLSQLGLGNREADHTFYVFGPNGELFDKGTELDTAMPDTVPIIIKEIRVSGKIYFEVQIKPCRYRFEEYRFDLDNERILIKVADPCETIGRSSDLTIEGQSGDYQLGLSNWHSDSVNAEGEEAGFMGNFYQDMLPYSPPVILSRPIVGVMGIDLVSQQPQLYYDAEHSAQIKVLSTGLYDFRDGEFVNVDSDNDHFEAATVNHITNVTSCTAKAETNSDGTYYVVTVVELYDKVYTYCFSIFLDYYTIGDVNLEDPRVLAKYDDDKNGKISLAELESVIMFETQSAGPDVTRVRVTLPKNNPLVGELTISCTKTLLLLGNNNTLTGSIRAESVADNDWHEIYDLHCVSPTYGEGEGSRSGVGFSGHGEVFPRDCSFTGYHIGMLWAADDWETQKAPSEDNISRRQMSTAIIDCDIGFLYDPQSTERSGMSNNYSGMTFFRNEVAFQVESQDDIREAGDILKIDGCVFVDNGFDVFNKSEYVVKMPDNYFGTYTGDIESADAREVLRKMDPEKDLQPAVLKGVNQGQGNGWIFGTPQALRAYRRGDYWYQLRVDQNSCCLFGEEGTISRIDNADAETGLQVDENYAGKLDVQQLIEETVQYESIATWDFSKEDEAQ